MTSSPADDGSRPAVQHNADEVVAKLYFDGPKRYDISSIGLTSLSAIEFGPVDAMQLHEPFRAISRASSCEFRFDDGVAADNFFGPLQTARL
jgi:hypothetical protein